MSASKVEKVPAEPGQGDAQALADVIKSLAPLSNDERKRVLYAATAFYRLPGER